MKVLFIGGTGRLSKDVAVYTVKCGHDVYLFTRGSDDRKRFVQNDYHMIYGDIRNVEQAKAVLKGYYFDVVIDFITYDVMQLQQTLDILEGIYNQYIFISTAAVYKKRNEDEIFSEDKTKVGNDKWSYSLNKIACEHILEEYFDGKDEWYTIIRPGVTYGNTRVPYPIVPLDNKMEWSFIDRILRGRGIPVFDNGEIVTTLTHTRDFAVGVVGLFQNNKARNEAFHITTNDTVTWGGVLDCIENILNVKVERHMLSQQDIYERVPYYKEILVWDKGHDMRFDNSKICGVVPDFSPCISLTDGLYEMIEYYKNNKELQKIDWRWNGEMDRLCKNGFYIGAKGGIKKTVNYLSGYFPVVRRMISKIKLFIE